MSRPVQGGEQSQNEDLVTMKLAEAEDSVLDDSTESDEYDNADSQQSMEEIEDNLQDSAASADSSYAGIEEEEDDVAYEQEENEEYDEGEAGIIDEEEELEENSGHQSVVPGSADDLMQDESSDSSNDSLYKNESVFDLRGHKNALKGFTDDDQNRIFPMVDEQSQALFELVQELEDEQLKSSERALLEVKAPVAIPSHHLAFIDGGPEIKLRIVDDATLDSSGSQDETDNDDERKLLQEPTGNHTPTRSSNSAIVTNVTDVPDKILAALPTDLFSREKKDLLMKTFELGWKREIVMRSNCYPGKKMGDVYYFSPDGVKFRSSKQVALYLAKKPQVGLTVDHFSFAKARVSFDPNQETIRQAYSGKGSPSPTKSQSSGGSSPLKHADVEASEVSVADSHHPEESESPPAGTAGGPATPARASSSRRSIQPPKRYATADSVLFNEKKPKLAANSKTVNSSIELEEGGMEMGMLPPKYPRDMEESYSKGAASGSGAGGGPGKSGLSTGGSGNGDKDVPVVRRGRPPKHGGKRHLVPQKRPAERALGGNDTHNSADDEDGPMFGISALTRTTYGTSFVDPTGGYRGAGYDGDSSEDINDGEVRDQNEEGLQPCSIRCPGMSGDIPTLQCRRCLCLYHPQCLGLPNQNYKNFFCANCEDDDGAGESQQQQHHQEHRVVHSRNNMNVHHNLPQQHHRQQQLQNDQRIRLVRGGYGKRPPPSLIRMQGRPPSHPQHHMGQQQQQSHMMSQMRGLDPRKMMMKGSSGSTRGSGLQLGRGSGALRNPMRLELPKLNLRPILKRNAEMGVGLQRGMGIGGLGRGRGRPPRSGGAPGTGINLPQFLKNNRINAGGAVTITPIGLHGATQSTYRKMGGGGPSSGGSSSHLPVPKLPIMRPIRTSLGGEANRLPNQRMMRGGMINRGGRGQGMVMASPYRMLKPKMPFTEPEGDESLQQIQISMGGGSSSKMSPQQLNVNSGAAQRLGVVGVKGFPQGVVTIGDKKYIAVRQPYRSSLLKKVGGEKVNNNLSSSADKEDLDEADLAFDEAAEEDGVNENKDIVDSNSRTENDQENVDADVESKDKLDLSVQNSEESEDRDDGAHDDALEEENKDEADLNISTEIDQENLTEAGDGGEILDSNNLERSEIKAL